MIIKKVSCMVMAVMIATSMTLSSLADGRVYFYDGETTREISGESKDSGEITDSGEEEEEEEEEPKNTSSGSTRRSSSTRATNAPNEVVTDGGVGNSDITLKVTESGGGGGGGGDGGDTDVIIATVPLELPIIMDMDGKITLPSDAKIINNSADKGIMVSAINVAVTPEWTASEWVDTINTRAAAQKQIALSFRGDFMALDGSVSLTADNWKIAKGGELPITMNAIIPKQDTAYEEKIATVGFTIGWSGDDTAEGGSAADTVVVTFSAPNGIIIGNSRVVIPTGGTVSFPAVESSDFTQEFDKWIDPVTSMEVTAGTPVTKNMVLTAVFKAREASPQNWFVATTSTVTGLSPEYLALADAPSDLVIPATIGGSKITAIADNAFKSRDAITSIVIPEGVTTVGASAFEGCASLINVGVPDTLKGLGSKSFLGCSSLVKIKFGTILEELSTYTFQDCTSLEEVVLLGSIKKIPNATFSNCPKLVSIKMPNTPSGKNYIPYSPWGATNATIESKQNEEWDNNPVIKSNYMEASAWNAVTGELSIKASGQIVEVPSSIDGIRVSTLVKISEASSSTKINKIVLNGGVETIKAQSIYLAGDYLKTIDTTGSNLITLEGNNRFQTVENFVIPDTVEHIGDSAFAQYPGGNLKLPKNLKTIGQMAFYLVPLKEVVIPAGVTSVGPRAFDGGFNGTSVLTSVVIEGGACTSIGADAFIRNPNITKFEIHQAENSIPGAPWGANIQPTWIP